MKTPPSSRSKPVHTRILAGSFVLLSGTGLTAALNLTYNIVVARFLGPDGFGQATAIYTLLTLLSAVTLSYQLMVAKAAARSKSGEAVDLRAYSRSAWAAAAVVALLLLGFRETLRTYLHLSSASLPALLAVGSLFYIPLGVRRGRVQGAYGFRSLAVNLVLEGVIRLGGSAAAAGLGYGVKGVVAANAAAIAAAYFAVPSTPSELGAHAPVRFGQAHRELAQALVFFSGQAFINNCDIVLVKHFFAPPDAGLYAMVAMVGRVVFALCQAVVNSMVPVVAGTCEEERRSPRILATALLLIFSIGAVLSVALLLAPAELWSGLFGRAFTAGSLPSLLALYAFTSVVYSLSAVMIAYEMSYKIANTSWIQLVFSGFIIAAICRFHTSLAQVIVVQLIFVSAMLLPIAVPFLRVVKRKKGSSGVSGTIVRFIRRVEEDKVIAEFLQSDFHKADYRKYHEVLAQTVYTPDLTDAKENDRRRALFATRHLALWQELPHDTEWWEAELDPRHLARVLMFPRAQWRKLAGGNFAVAHIAEQLEKQKAGAGRLAAKISQIRVALTQSPGTARSSVLLIGIDAEQPLVAIDGNHRLVAAVLEGRTDRLRFFCGLSPSMRRCCWYNTSPRTLLRYLGHLLCSMARNPNAELARLLEASRASSAGGTDLPATIGSSLRATK